MFGFLKRTVKKSIKILIETVSTEKRQRYLESKYPLVRIGQNLTISEDTIINTNVSIGNNCYLNNVEIGSYSYLSFNVTMTNTKIGKFCSISQNVGACLGRHPSHTFVSTSPVFYSTHNQCGVTFSDHTYFSEMGNCVIGNDVCIGANAVIMDNVTIGNGAFIGSGCIVTKDVPAYAIVVGVPAKVIKYRFHDDQIQFLQEFNWWDKDEKWLRANFKDLADITLFINKHRQQVM